MRVSGGSFFGLQTSIDQIERNQTCVALASLRWSTNANQFETQPSPDLVMVVEMRVY